jgi:hypothetical protein
MISIEISESTRHRPAFEDSLSVLRASFQDGKWYFRAFRSAATPKRFLANLITILATEPQPPPPANPDIF